MNINLIVKIVAPLIVSALCFGAGFYLSIKHGHYLGFADTKNRYETQLEIEKSIIEKYKTEKPYENFSRIKNILF